MTDQTLDLPVIRVSSHSPAAAVAGAIAGALREHGRADVQAIGAGAVNQAVKALAITAQFMAGGGRELTMTPAFVEVEIGGEVKTAIRFEVTVTGSGHVE